MVTVLSNSCCFTNFHCFLKNLHVKRDFIIGPALTPKHYAITWDSNCNRSQWDMAYTDNRGLVQSDQGLVYIYHFKFRITEYGMIY